MAHYGAETLTSPVLFRTQAYDVAVVDETTGETLSREELASWSNRLARWLVAHGVCSGDLVALGMGRSLELAVAQCAVQAVGAECLGLDLDSPARRQAEVLRQAAPACVLTSARAELRAEWPAVVLDRLDLSRFSDRPIDDEIG